MRTPDRRIRIVLQAAALTTLALPAVSLAQDPEPAPRVFDCGPSIVKPGDLAAVNVGYPGRNTGPVEVLVRILDAAGTTLVERRLSLTPGQSRSVRLRIQSPDTRPELVRGEFFVQSGPERPRLVGTFQVLGDPSLSYGPNLLCSGDTGSRGPA